MKTTDSYIDVLFLTALEEERFLLDKWAEEEASSPLFSTDDERLICFNGPAKVGNLRIGIADLGGMGNIWASARALHLIRTYNPRCVLLVGIAGGAQDRISLGDVGYSTRTVYSCYGKIRRSDWFQNLSCTIKGKKKEIHELRSRLLALGVDPGLLYVPILDINQVEEVLPHKAFVTTASALAGRTDGAWQAQARTWFADYIDPYSTKWPHKDDKTGKPTPQVKPDFEARRCCPSTIASGEFVVANESFQKQLDTAYSRRWKRTKIQDQIRLFDMESYGVGMACPDSVIFGTIKGVSDYAGGDKNDAHRLGAIACATAFATSLLEFEKFANQIRTTARAVAEPDVCLWGRQLRKCEYAANVSQPERLGGIRQCIYLSDTDLADKEVEATRFFDGIEPSIYSRCIEQALDEKNARLLLVFPYSIEDMLRFLESLSGGWPKLAKDLRTLRGDKSKGGLKKQAEYALKCGEIARSQFSHFRRCNEVCLQKIAIAGKKAFFDVASKVCRVFLTRRNDEQQIWNDPLVLLFPAMFGTAVPLLWLEQKAESALRDEATYIQRHLAEASDPAGSTNMAIRYSERSRSLLVLGCCDSIITGTMRPTFESVTGLRQKLAKASRGDMLTTRTFLEEYQLFPVLRILEKHGIDPIDYLDGFDELNMRQKTHVTDYFKTLITREPEVR